MLIGSILLFLRLKTHEQHFYKKNQGELRDFCREKHISLKALLYIYIYIYIYI